MQQFGLCVYANSTGSNLLVASAIWFANGVLLITVELRSLCDNVPPGCWNRGKLQGATELLTVRSSVAEKRSAASV